MFKKINVLGFDRKYLIWASVKSAGKGKVNKSEKYEYNFVSLRDVLEKIHKKFKFRKVRILLSEDLSYLLKVDIPEGMKQNDQRDYIKKVISEKIPEKLDDSDWDYKLLKTTKTEKGDLIKQVIVFAPVKDLYKRIIEILESLKVTIEAVESEQLSLTRSDNPIIGIAKKTDVSGKDEDILNINPDFKSESVREDTSPSPSKNDNNKTTIALIIVLLVSAIIAAIYLPKSTLFNKSNETLKRSDTSSKNNNLIETEISETPRPTIEVPDYSGYRVNILNGSGEGGVAQEAAFTLGFEGFSDVEVGNATNSGFVVSEVRVKPNVSGEVYETIDRALNSDYKIKLQEENLDQEYEFDIEIILGEKISQ